MFEHGASQERKAFEFGIEQVNRNRNILKNIRLIYTTENVHDVFSASKKGKKYYRTCHSRLVVRMCSLLLGHRGGTALP